MFNRQRAEELKKEQGRETKWLADRCGVKPNTVRLYLSGEKNPSLSVIKHMALAFDVPESELILEHEQKKAS